MRRLFFVDDDEVLLRSLKRAVTRQLDWQCSFFHSAAEALDALAHETVDAVVSDYDMPGMNGIAFLQEVKRRSPATVRAMLTAHAGIVKLPPAVVHQIWSKPWDTQGLSHSLRQLFAVRNLLSDPAVQGAAGDVDKLPSVPTLVADLLTTLADPDCSADEVAAVVSKDPAMTAKVLQLVNSAFIGPAAKISNIQRAVAHVGTGIVRNLVVSESVIQAFADHGRLPGFDIAALQADALVTAKVASQLFDDRASYDDAFAAGLLKGVGQLVLAAQLPAYFAELLRRSRETHGPLHLVEKAMGNVTHAEVGAYLLGLWGIPAPIIEGVSCQFIPRPATERRFDVVDSVFVANRLIEAVRGNSPVGRSLGGILDESWLEHLGAAHRLPEWHDIAARAVNTKMTREHPRRAVQWPAEWQTVHGPTRNGEVRDVSTKGLFLCPTPHIDTMAGTEIHVRIDIPGQAELRVSGVVRWNGANPRHRCHGFGIEFDHPRPEIEKYLKPV